MSVDPPLPAAKDEAQQLTHVNIKLPPFWSSDPHIWFAQVEAQFATKRITKPQTKFAYIVSALQPEVAQEVRDILLAPQDEDSFAKLKEELIKRTSASEQRRLQLLLSVEELGDRKPSQLLRRMQQLLGERQIEASILKQLFLQRLPTNVQLILASAGATLSHEQLAEIADRIMEIPIPAIQPVLPTPPSEIADLRAEIARLNQQVQALQVQARGPPPTRGRSRSRYTPRSGSATQSSDPRPSSQNRSDSGGAAAPLDPTLCWYHSTFGSKAAKCKPGCTWTSRDQGNA